MDTCTQRLRHPIARVFTVAVMAIALSLNVYAVELSMVTAGPKVGGPFDIEVYINNASDFYGCGFDLVYDPALAALVDADEDTPGVQPSITEAELLRENGGLLTALLAALEDGNEGRVVVGVTRKGAGLVGINVDTPTLLLTLHMEGHTAGDTMMLLENTVTQDSVGTKLSVDPVVPLALEVVENAIPTLNPIGDKSVNENALLTFTVSASDTDVDDTLSLGASGLPAGATFDVMTGVFRWTPDFSAAGTYGVDFEVTDDGLPPRSAMESITITVNNVNRAPELGSVGNRSVTAGDTVSIILSGSDGDGDSLTFTATPLPGNATFDSGTRRFNWVTSASSVGSHGVTFAVRDNGTPTLSDSELVTITVAPPNSAPVINDPGPQMIAAASTLSFTVSASDADDDTLTLSAGTLPAGASFVPASGTFTWTPTDGDIGTHDVVFTAKDPSQASDSVTVTITVVAGNTPPVIDDPGAQITREGDTLTFTIVATDLEDEHLTLGVMELPADATFVAETGVFLWTPATDTAGTYTVTFTATDSANAMGLVAVNITVNPANSAPEITDPGAQTVQETELLTFSITATDADDDTVTLSADELPSEATFDAATGTFSWTPKDGTAGEYEVTFTATDSEDATDSLTVVITVTEFCVTPAAPEGLSASDGAFSDVVRLEWAAVAGVGIEYRVYRSASDDFAAATILSAWTRALSYDDTTAGASDSGEAPGACTPQPAPEDSLHYYFVVARAGDGCESEASASDSGFLDPDAEPANPAPAAEARRFARALPARELSENERLAYPGEDLAVRLHSDDGIDLDSVWFEVGSTEGRAITIEGLVLSDGGLGAWVLLPANEYGQSGDTVSLSAGALTLTGAPLNVVTFHFILAEKGDDASEQLLQPSEDSLDLGGLIKEESTDEVTVYHTEVEDAKAGLAEAYELRGGVYETPQRVWLPIPETSDGRRLQIYYFHEEGDATGWYAGDSIEGWLMQDSYLYATIDGVNYLGFTVRHSATVRLGTIEPTSAPSNASMFGTLNSPGALTHILVMALVALSLLLTGKVGTRKERN